MIERPLRTCWPVQSLIGEALPATMSDGFATPDDEVLCCSFGERASGVHADRGWVLDMLATAYLQVHHSHHPGPGNFLHHSVGMGSGPDCFEMDTAGHHLAHGALRSLAFCGHLSFLPTQEETEACAGNQSGARSAGSSPKRGSSRRSRLLCGLI